MRSNPRRTGRNGSGFTAAPASAAIDEAAASACCVAVPPCLSGNWLRSPAAVAIISAAASGLLRSDPALLDGKAGDVSDSKDVCQPGHLTMRVDRYEALEGLRYPFDAYSTQSGQRDGAIRRDASVGDEA